MPQKPVLVQKFGGSVLTGADGFRAVAEVVAAHCDRHRVVVLLSAIHGVTDLLQAAIDESASGDQTPPSAVEAIARQRQVIEELQVDAQHVHEFLEQQREMLRGALEGVRLLGQCPDETRAQVLASGEFFASKLLADVLLAEGVETQWRDTELLPTGSDDWLDAVVDIDAARSRLSDCLDGTDGVLVIPGFSGRNADGAPQLLGRNGTDYSAAAVATALGADRCQIWKEMDGFYTADPRIVGNARCLPEVSYNEAIELSWFGARVISARAVAQLAAAGMPCEIRNTFRPDHPGTLIHGEAHSDSVVRGVTHLDDVATLTLSGGGMRGRVGTAGRVMQALARERISILLIVQSSSEASITLCVRAGEAANARRALEAEFHFEQLHGLIDPVQLHDNRAVITLVGDGMQHRRGVAARFLTAISSAGVNVEVIAQGSTECAISLVVDGKEAWAATRASHTAFFSETTHIDVVLLGCGNVGAELLSQFQRQQQSLADAGLELRVRAIANSRRMLVARDRIDLSQWREELEADGIEWSIDSLLALRGELGLLNPTVIDCTTNDELAAQYALILEGGFNVVAANKKANTASMAQYRGMRASAARSFRQFLYETNVGAGLPVIDTLQGLIRSGDRLRQFEGILSGSLSMIFGRLEDGQSFSDAVSEARELGFTEPDPRDDLSGMDVARKLLIIAREVGMEAELDDVEVEPVIPADFAAGCSADELMSELKALDDDFAAQISAAAGDDAVLRYVGTIEDGRCRVAVRAIPRSSPLAAIRDGENALVLVTDYYQPIPLVLRGYGAGAAVTAAGVFGDLLRTVWRPID